jgi:hypothetical protein
MYYVKQNNKVARNLARGLLTAMACMVSGFVYADATLSMQSDGLTRTLQIKGDRVFFAVPEEKTDVLFDTTTQTMNVIDHKQQTIYPVNEETLNAVKSQIQGLQGMMSQALEGLSPEQQAQMQSMLGGFGFGGNKPAAEPQVSIKEVGTAKYAGISCTQFQVSVDGVAEGTSCISSGNSLGLSSADYATLKAAQDFMLKMGRQAGDLAKQFGQSIPNYGDFQAQGILISAKSQREQGSFEMTSVNTDAIANNLDVPQGYKIQDVASQMQ